MRMLLLAVILASLAAVDPETLPDPRPGAWILDHAGRIAGEQRAAIDRACRQVRDAGHGEVAVVVIASSGGRDLRRSATALFNRWRLGSALRNDGVLVIAALDDRRAELVLGDGVDVPDQVTASQRIFDEVMKPRLRAGDPGDALLAAVDACDRRILAPPEAHVPDQGPPRRLVAASDGTMASDPAPEADTPDATATQGIGTSPGPTTPDPAPGTMEGPAPGAAEDPAPVRPPSYQSSSGPSTWESVTTPPLSWVLGFGLLAITLGGSRLWWRHHSRTCPVCRRPMRRLDERADDAFLRPGQRAEERVGSVDYDVWRCDACERVEVLSWAAWFSGYERCGSCRSKTVSRRRATLRAATTSHGGLVRITLDCAHCDFHRTWTETTPRIPESSSSGSSWSSSGSSSSSSSSSGSSSSSSGGSSSGSGGGGSW